MTQMINSPLVYGLIVPLILFIIFTAAFWVVFMCASKDDVETQQVKRVFHKADSNGTTSESANAILDQAQVFQLADLKNATRNFVNKVGEGAFGPVFYGKLSNGQEIAVKVLAIDSKQGSHEFYNEVMFLSRAHHKNVVSLIGYHASPTQRMLVYEFLSGGTLEDHLFDMKRSQPLTWKERLKIALDAAKGLEYLHIDCVPTIIHRDVKSGNILLTKKLSAKVADFGLSKLGPEEGASHVSTIVKGTSGYLDPEYYETMKLTQKSDVYSFGVVLLELLTGREALFSDPSTSYMKLCDWARNYLIAGNLESIVDPVLQDSYNVDALWKVADIAMYSVEPRSIHRPSMSEIVQELKEAMAIEFGSQGPVFEYADMVVQSTPWDDTEILFSGVASSPLSF